MHIFCFSLTFFFFIFLFWYWQSNPRPHFWRVLLRYIPSPLLNLSTTNFSTHEWNLCNNYDWGVCLMKVCYSSICIYYLEFLCKKELSCMCVHMSNGCLCDWVGNITFILLLRLLKLWVLDTLLGEGYFLSIQPKTTAIFCVPTYLYPIASSLKATCFN